MTYATDILRAAAERLRTAPLPPKFALKERLSGALLDVNALRGRGWRLLTTMADGDPALWCNSVWIERTIDAGEAGPFLVHVSFGPNVEDVDKAMAGRAPFPAYLRRVHVFRWKDGGLSFDVPDDPPPPDLFHQLSLELGEAVLETRPPMLRDMDRLADGYDIDLPLAVWPSEFARHLAIIQTMAWNEWRNNQHDGAERLLMPVLSVLARPGSDIKAETSLRESTDGDTLWRILFVWLNVADDSDAVRHYIAFLIDRALSGELAEPLGVDGWSTLSMGLQQAGEGAASLAALERVAALGKDIPDFPKSLWKQARLFANQLGSRPAEAPLDGLRDLIRVLVSHEDILAPMDGYWSLLGLAFLLNGEKSDLYLDRLKKAIIREDAPAKASEHTAPDETSEEVQADAAETPEMPTPRFLSNPLGWQSFLIGLRGDSRIARRQLAVFPTPILESPEDPHAFPIVPIAGATPGDMWRGIDPDIYDHVDGIIDDIRANGRPISDADVQHPSVDELEISDENGFFITRLLQPTARRCEITALLVSGVRIDDPKRPDAPFRIVPLARPAGSPKNAVLSVWRLFPYPDNGCGEAALHLPDGRPLGAILPFFASDRHLLPRGVPCPAFVFATGIEAHVVLGAANMDDDGMGGFCFLGNVEQDATRAYYEAAGIVRSVRRVRFLGTGERAAVLRLDLDVGPSLPFPLPLYIHPSSIADKGSMPRRGDLVSAKLLLYADLFNPTPATLRAWRRAHPHGPGEEPTYRETPSMRVLESFHKVGKKELEALRRKARKNAGENDGDEDADDIEPLTPENLDAVQAALTKLRNDLGHDNCVRWFDNPSRTDIAARVAGAVHRYRVFLRRDEEPPPVSGDTPPGIEPLVVRITDSGDTYEVAYEGFPSASTEDLPF